MFGKHLINGEPNRQIVDSLVINLADDLPVSHASRKAGIDKATFYRWLKRYPVFAIQMALARSEPIARARQAQQNAVAGLDPRISPAEAAFKWSERRDRDYQLG